MGREGFGICDKSTTFSGLTLPLTASIEDVCGGACVHKLKFITQAASKLSIFLTTILRGMEEDRTVKDFSKAERNLMCQKKLSPTMTYKHWQSQRLVMVNGSLIDP
jgi:hypothetical protein